jgi:cytochrome c oxidase subunit 3
MASPTTTVLDPELAQLEREAPPAGPPSPPIREGEPPFRARRVEAVPPPVSNAKLAMLAFIVFESMLFAGLLGGYIVLRWGSRVWPPLGQPYLPIAVTWLNSAVLLGSLVPLISAGRAYRFGARVPFARGLALTAIMGSTFLAIQGFEWVRLLAHGMTVVHGTYGGIFLLLIGTHGLHVLGAVIWMATLAVLAATRRIAPQNSTALDIATLYWYFVCAVWIVLFALVYLA